MKRRHYLLFAALLILIAVVRVTCTYRWTAQGFDEPVHVSAAMELLDRHTYTFDPVHPPLARLAIGIPLYLAGERYPRLSAEDAAKPYSVVGNRILYGDGHYLRNLALARSAMLPFLVAASLLVFLWARREFGDFAAVMSVLLFTTTPMVLALSGLAYTDMVAATTQFGALFALVNWLREPNKRSTFLLGGATGLALMSKLTSLLFLPVAGFAILACWWLVARRESSADQHQFHWKQLVAATAIAACVLWGGYGFSVGHLREQMGISPQAMPSFQHFPGPLAKLARTMIIKDPPVPAPALLSGLAVGWVLNKTAPPAYILGHIKNGGWWYFFLLGLAVKTPLPLLILCSVGLLSVRDCVGEKQWSTLAPGAAVVAILTITATVKYNAGVRHVLVVFPLLAVIAGRGCAYLWQAGGKRQPWMRLALTVLLLWQVAESLSAGSDFISYFNELAGRDPSRVMVAGCDLDCGQDIFRLAQELRTRNISHLSLAVWSSADMDRMGLPPFQVMQPFAPVTGWIAVSERSMRFGDVLHETYPPSALAWLDRYQPVAHVGRTILLYYIPEN